MTGAPRILIVRVGAMGDVLHGMPAVAALRAAMPDAFLGWAVEPRWAPLLSANKDSPAWEAHLPLVDGVHLVEAKAWSKRPFSLATLDSVRALRHALRGEHYDVAIDLQGTIRSAVIARLSGARTIVGHAHPRETPARWLYTQRVEVRAKHVVDQAAEIVSGALRTPVAPQAVELPRESAVERWCDGVVRDDPRRIVFLAPTAGWGAKQWPADKFAAVARACSRAGLRVLVNKAGPSDSIAGRVLLAADGAAEAVDCSVSQLIALLRRVDLVIAGDTGPLHLAAALGKPTVALFGPTDPARNGPFGAPARVLRNAESVTDHRRHSQTEAGLAAISTGDVLRAAGELLGLDLAGPHPEGERADALDP